MNPAPHPPPPPPPNILIVDDTPANLQLLSGLLQDKGYRPRPVPSGELALRAAEMMRPDLVLLDVSMPGMDGYETCLRLKRLPGLAGVPVIFISAHVDLAEKERGLRLGAVDFITKPFQLEEVESRIRTYMDLAGLRRERVRLAEEGAELRAALARSAILGRALGDFLGLIAEELRAQPEAVREAAAPVESPSGPSSAVVSRPFPGTPRPALTTLVEEARLLLEIGTTGQTTTREPAELGPCLEAARERTRALATERRVQLAAGPANLGRVRGSAGHWTRALHRLLETAVRRAREGSTLRLTATGDPVAGWLSLEVDGPELPAEALSDFFALRPATAPGAAVDDLGTGAALAERIVSLYGGRVRVENVPRVGLRWVIELPTV